MPLEVPAGRPRGLLISCAMPAVEAVEAAGKAAAIAIPPACQGAGTEPHPRSHA
jgi:hypothetical protein